MPRYIGWDTNMIAERHPMYPNTVVSRPGFHVSYNDVDTAPGLYGCVTTALVTGGKFYILRGDHRDAYAPLLDQGLDACITYYCAQPAADRHPFSDKLALLDA